VSSVKCYAVRHYSEMYVETAAYLVAADKLHWWALRHHQLQL